MKTQTTVKTVYERPISEEIPIEMEDTILTGSGDDWQFEGDD